MPQFKFSVARGGVAPQVAIGAGTVIAGGDAIEVNIDQTRMTRADAIAALDAVQRRMIEGKWPPL